MREYTPQAAAAICGVPAADIVQAAKWFGASRATLSLYCQGLNQSSHGTHNNAALINLHLATGHIGKPGAGPLSLTGQPNAMGGREVGGMANLLSAHRDLANPAHRAEVAQLWGIDSVPAQPGKTAVEMFDAIHRGEIKAVWIACTNPAQSMPDVNRVRAALERAQFVVVQEAYRNTDTVQYADLLLPATTWGEKEGTVTNSERRITRVRAAVAAPGEARADAEIATTFALRLGAALGNARAPRTVSLYGPGADFQRASRKHARARSRHHGPVVFDARNRGSAAMADAGRCSGRPCAFVCGRYFCHGQRPRAFRRRAASCRGGKTGCALSAGAQYGTAARSMAWHEPHRHGRAPI